MILQKIKLPYVVSSIIQFLLLLPFLNQGYIGSDWDSYALIGTVQNLNFDFLYLPSRPPGFPVYELFLGLLFFFTELFSFNFEAIFIFSQFIFVVGNNYLIYKLFDFSKKNNIFLYFVITFSPIYLISGYSVIDYHLGLFLGLIAIYFSLQSKNLILISVVLSLSIGVRLSNILFAIAVFTIFINFKQERTKQIKLVIYTFLTTLTIYLLPYINLWNNTLSNSLEKYTDMVCMFNLTNTNHDLYSRIGRFVLKQIDFFGIFGFIVLIYIVIKNFKKIDFQNNVHYLIILVFFQLSFLRLPTEEGHLLPAFIALILLLNTLDLNSKLLLALLFSTIVSNFVYFSFYEVDVEDSATEAIFNIDIKSGLLIQDFNARETIGINKEFHYLNGYKSIKKVWINGCPN